MVVAALGSVSNKNARGWYHSRETRGWGAAFTAVVADFSCAKAIGSPQEAVGSPQDALPEVEVAAFFMLRAMSRFAHNVACAWVAVPSSPNRFSCRGSYGVARGTEGSDLLARYARELLGSVCEEC